MSTNTFTPEVLTKEEIVQIRKALTHTYGNDYGIILFNKLTAGLN